MSPVAFLRKSILWRIVFFVVLLVTVVQGVTLLVADAASSTLLVLLALGSMGASVLVGVLIARGITRPLRTLGEMTRRIEEGDYTRAVPVDVLDEIGELARRFNLMRDGIAAREDQILRLAYRDVLTDLPNRALFNDRLHVAIQYNETRPGVARGAAHGFEPVQNHQRHARPSHGRPGAAERGPAAVRA
jgi:HAMP domain-containing protein